VGYGTKSTSGRCCGTNPQLSCKIDFYVFRGHPNSDMINTSMLRVSVATLNRVVFPHPQDGNLMLALERQATVLGENSVRVWAQPFGGAIRILNPTPLKEILGDIQFDSERSRREQDFRILIPSFKWELVKHYCLRHLEDQDDPELESLPHRELMEEFVESMHVNLNRDQYTVQPLGTIVENNPIPTDNAEVRGQPTVRLYRVFEARVIDVALCRKMLTASQSYSDQDLEKLALKNLQDGGRGWVNSILTLPLRLVAQSYLDYTPENRYRKIVVEHHELDESVLAILSDVNVQQYLRV
jgi:hypothetical protein